MYVDRKNVQRTYTDPRLAFAVEELPKNISEVRQRYDASTTALQVLHGKDLSGRLAIVTGANCGIGFETARSLAMHGCEVVLACRNQEAAEAAIVRIAIDKAAAGKRCRYMHCDLADMRSVQEFVNVVKVEFKHIDFLILNAAVFALPYSMTKDNVETTFQVCHLAHFYMTVELENRLSHMSRVVVVSSESHRFAALPIELTETVLSPMPSKFWSMPAYNNVKLCNVLFARELGRVRSNVCNRQKNINKIVSIIISDGKTKESQRILCILAIWFRLVYQGIGGFIDLFLDLFDHLQSHW